MESCTHEDGLLTVAANAVWLSITAPIRAAAAVTELLFEARCIIADVVDFAAVRRAFLRAVVKDLVSTVIQRRERGRGTLGCNLSISQTCKLFP